MADFPHQELTEQIIGCAIKVHRELGPGYYEEIYENALKHEMGKHGLTTEQQTYYPVYYDGIVVGKHRVDLMVEGAVVLELKATDGIPPKAPAQMISTLKACKLEVGLIINFNERVLKDGIKRIVLSRDHY